jgi:NAD+-dependent protein deacetylase sirtuin 4
MDFQRIALSTENTSTVDTLVELLQTRPCVVLSGAGCSTDSGIPDYRGPDGSLRGRQPIQFREFMGSETSRARYWARSMVGWPRFSASRPNAAHLAIAALEEAGFVRGVITQNVDELHQAAGSRTVVDLHGRLSEVRCMGCGRVTLRDEMQRRMQEMNTDFDATADRYVRGR